MTEHPGFGTMLAWLLDHRELGAQKLADRAGLNADEVHAVLAGDSPGEELLRRLGPALGFHAVDLFILARLAVPDDMAPLDATAAMWVKNTVTDAAVGLRYQKDGAMGSTPTGRSTTAPRLCRARARSAAWCIARGACPAVQARGGGPS